MKSYKPALLWLAVGLLVITLALKIPVGRLGDDPGPQALPLASGIIICLAALFSMLTAPYDAEDLGKMAILRVCTSVLLIGIYIQLMDRIGFVLSTTLFIGLQLIIMGQRKVLPLISLSILGSVTVYYVFNSLLRVPLATTNIGPVGI